MSKTTCREGKVAQLTLDFIKKEARKEWRKKINAEI